MRKLVCLVLTAMLLLGVVTVTQAEIPTDLNHLDLKIALYEFTSFDDPLGKAIEDKFNVSITPILLEGDINAQLRLWATSGELPDVFATTTIADGSRLWDFIDQGLIRSIPEEMLAKYPYTEAKTLRNEGVKLVKELTGEIYIIPRPESATNMWTATQNYMVARNDWMEKLGIEAPNTMDELYELLRAFTFDDPDGNGQDDTYGLTGNYAQLYVSFGAYPGYWIEKDGKYIPGYLDEEPMVEALSWFRKIYSEGILDPELATNDSKFAQGTFGAYLRNLDEYWFNRSVVEIFGGANQDKGNVLDVVKAIGPFSKDADSPKLANPRVDGLSGNEYNADLSDEALERLLMIDNWLLHGEGNDLKYWGLKDIDYTINAEGNYEMIEEEALRTKYPSIFIQNWPCWDFDYNALPVNEGGSPYITEEVKAICKEIRERYNAALDLETCPVSVAATYAFVDASSDYTYNHNAELVEIITGSDDVRTMYNAMVAEAYEYGLQDVIDQKNELLTE